MPNAASPSPAHPSSAEVVVVGSGVVGSLIAYELAAKGASVVMLEAGPRFERWQAVEAFRNMPFARRLQSDYQGFFPQSKLAPGPVYVPDNHYLALSGPDGGAYKQGYLRAVGGTTWHWAASCWRHLPVDMKMHSTYGVGRDWPITYAELEPYYVRAEKALGVAGPSDPKQQSPSERSQPYPLPMIPWAYLDERFASIVNPHGYDLIPIPQARSITPFEGRPGCCGNNNCQPLCPIGAMYNGIHHVQKAEAAGVKLIDKAVVYKIETDAHNRIAALHWFDANRQSHRITGRAFVLACNGVETPRLLLMTTDDRNKRGIANSSDQVGRNMMDHSGLHATFLADEPLWAGRGPAQSSCMVGFRDGPFRSKYSANKIILDNLNEVTSATMTALSKGLVGKELDDEIRRRAARFVDLSISLEPLPSPENRLTLSTTRKDPLGLPCPDIYYDVGAYVRTGAAHVSEQLKHIGSLFGATEFQISKTFNANNHIMGGTIMGADHRTSVVDGNCRTYDHENLWLPGGGPIPSASVVNSTLSMVALGLRALDNISATLEHRS